jgi:hypothetical protein
MAGLCEHGDKSSGSIKKARFFDKLSDSQLFNNIHYEVSK